jgi:hypothetical protein
MSEAFKKAYEENRDKLKSEKGDGPIPVIKTPWDDAISKEDQARNSSATRPADK